MTTVSIIVFVPLDIAANTDNFEKIKLAMKQTAISAPIR